MSERNRKRIISSAKRRVEARKRHREEEALVANLKERMSDQVRFARDVHMAMGEKSPWARPAEGNKWWWLR
jgi:hypothetical protein